MMTDAKALSALGLCKKAGKLVIGFDAVAAAIAQSKVKLLATTQDISPKSAKEIIRLADQHNINHLRLNAGMDDIKRILGKKAGVLAITDEGLAALTAAKSMARQVEEESV